jgi:hypothetical protein
MQQRANSSNTHRLLEKPRIALALQGGGSHGASRGLHVEE